MLLLTQQQLITTTAIRYRDSHGITMGMSYRYQHKLPPPPDVEPEWAYELEESVMLTMTGETGFVVGRKESLFDQDQYEIFYVNAAGNLTRQWWPEGALEPINLDS